MANNIYCLINNVDIYINKQKQLNMTIQYCGFLTVHTGICYT